MLGRFQNIDFEKRQAKGFPRFEIPELIKERALELVQVEEAAEHGELSALLAAICLIVLFLLTVVSL